MREMFVEQPLASPGSAKYMRVDMFWQIREKKIWMDIYWPNKYKFIWMQCVGQT